MFITLGSRTFINLSVGARMIFIRGGQIRGGTNGRIPDRGLEVTSPEAYD